MERYAWGPAVPGEGGSGAASGLVAACLVVAGVLAGCGSSESAAQAPKAEPNADRYATQRTMLRDQLEASGIRDARVLAAMDSVPRHRFVPEALVGSAYDDRALSIGHSQTISQPYVVAFMTEALGLEGGERVLEIGTGSGYQAAVLAACGAQVWSIEILEPLARRAREVLEELGVGGVHLRIGDGYAGWPEEAPFDAILVTAAPDHVPQPLLDQLADGGRMILPVGRGNQELVLIERHGEHFERASVLPVRFVPMTGRALGER